MFLNHFYWAFLLQFYWLSEAVERNLGTRSAAAISNAPKLNRFFSSARVLVRAFVIFKARWTCVLNCLDHNIENLSEVIIGCCVLHNIWQMKSGSYIVKDDVLETGEKDSKKGETWISCTCVTRHSDGLCKCWQLRNDVSFLSNFVWASHQNL